jgi:hypothetical protein
MVLYLYACHAISWGLAGAVSTASLAVTKRNLEKNLTPVWLNQTSGGAIANFAGPIAVLSILSQSVWAFEHLKWYSWLICFFLGSGCYPMLIKIIDTATMLIAGPPALLLLNIVLWTSRGASRGFFAHPPPV